MPEITIQLYTLREQLQADYAGTIRALAEIGFRNVEPAGFPGTTPEAAAQLFAELGIRAPSCHGPLPLGEQKNQVIETAQALGHRYLITGVPPGGKDNFTGLDRVKAMAEQYVEAAAVAGEHGLLVGYHNHDWDVAEIEGRRAHQIFMDHTPDHVLWEADLFWVARGGLDPATFVRELGARAKCLHAKDGIVDQSSAKRVATAAGEVTVGPEDPPFLPAGTGEVDLKAAVGGAGTTVEYVAVELDRYVGDIMAAVKESFEYLRDSGIATPGGA